MRRRGRLKSRKVNRLDAAVDVTAELSKLPFLPAGVNPAASMNESLSTSDHTFPAIFRRPVFRSSSHERSSIYSRCRQVGARHEAKFEGTPPFRKSWVSHLAARSGGVGVVRDCCEVGAIGRSSFLLKGFVGSRVGECLPRW